MKMIKTLALTALLGCSVMASDTLTVKMADSENGLTNIQKGFLYNSMPMVRNGIKEVRKANDIFTNVDETKKYLPKEKQHMKNVAYNAAKRINDAADEMEIHLAHNEMGKAQEAYSRIVTACSACHAVVRGW
jgi:cytochrome c553